jgi:hypothetical protein
MNAEFQQGTLDAALEISARRAKTLREIKSLLEDDRNSDALKMMREYLQVKTKTTTRRLALVKGK